MVLFTHTKLLVDKVFFLLEILSFSISDFKIETFLDFLTKVFSARLHLITWCKYINMIFPFKLYSAVQLQWCMVKKKEENYVADMEIQSVNMWRGKNGTTPKIDDVAFKVAFLVWYALTISVNDV